MRRKVFAVVVSVGLAVLVTAALAQAPFGVDLKQEKRNSYAVNPTQNDSTVNYQVIQRDPAGPGLVRITTVVADHSAVVNELIEKWKQAGNKSERDKLQQSLRATLTEQFQSRLLAHQKEIEQLEAEVKRLRQQLELRRQKQDEIVRFRMEQLLREAQGLGWGTEPTPRTGALLSPGSSAAGGNMTLNLTNAEVNNAVPSPGASPAYTGPVGVLTIGSSAAIAPAAGPAPTANPMPPTVTEPAALEGAVPVTGPAPLTPTAPAAVPAHPAPTAPVAEPAPGGVVPPAETAPATETPPAESSPARPR